jgi:DNA-directed RNA polymerase subunit RPC12/RpoP
MGEVYSYECKCKYKKKLEIGAGMWSINRERIRQLCPDDVMAEFDVAESEKNVTSYLLENALASCASCRQLIVVPYFHYETKSGEKKEYWGKCTRCGDKPLIWQDYEHVRCPRCGEEMSRRQVGQWD